MTPKNVDGIGDEGGSSCRCWSTRTESSDADSLAGHLRKMTRMEAQVIAG